jgi:hypothetical protein
MLCGGLLRFSWKWRRRFAVHIGRTHEEGTETLQCRGKGSAFALRDPAAPSSLITNSCSPHRSEADVSAPHT